MVAGRRIQRERAATLVGGEAAASIRWRTAGNAANRPLHGVREECELHWVTGVPAQSGCWKFCGSVPLVEGILYFDISPNVPSDISSNITN
jgi:hypothetical protein